MRPRRKLAARPETGEIMSDVIRVFVEKKPGFDVEAQHIRADLVENLGMKSVTDVKLLNRYDISGMSAEEFAQARDTIFSEPNVDNVYEETYEAPAGYRVFAMEYLPGQYDQRADSAAQCVQLLTQGERPQVATARVVAIGGGVSDAELEKKVLSALTKNEHGVYLALSPEVVQQIIAQLGDLRKKFAELSQTPIVLTSQIIRVYLSRMISQFYPDVYVLSFNEVTGSVQIQAIGNITLQPDPKAGR